MSNESTSGRRAVLLAGVMLAIVLAGCTATGGTTSSTGATTSSATGTSTTTGMNATSSTGMNATSSTGMNATSGTGMNATSGTGMNATSSTGMNATSTGMNATSSGAAPQTTNDPASAVANGMAAVRVAHLSPDAPNVDVYVDSQRVLSNVGFRTVSQFLVLEPGTHHVRVTAAGNSSQTVFDDNLTVDAKAYTVAALGEVSGKDHPFAVKVFAVDVKKPSGNTAAVRLVHAVPDAPAVDVTVKGTNQTLFDNVAFGQASEYASVPAGTYALQVRAHTPNHDGKVVKTVNVTVKGGTVDSVYAVGYLSPPSGAGNKSFGLEVTRDSGGSS